MRFLLVGLMLLASLSFSFGQSPDSQARAALALAAERQRDEDRPYVYSLPDGMRQYQRADRPRVGLPLWHVPGGLDTVTGWESKLYVSEGGTVKTWMGFVPSVQRNATVQRQRWVFPRGKMLIDELYKDGKLFEVRQRTKNLADAHWSNAIKFRDLALAPKGYVGLGTVSCAGCHDNATLVGGDDGAFSLTPAAVDTETISTPNPEPETPTLDEAYALVGVARPSSYNGYGGRRGYGLGLFRRR